MDDSALEKVETKRKELEATIARLRKSLRHWQTVELDYEGLREEFVRVSSDASEEECLQVARDFKPESLDENDLKALMRDAIKQPSRRPQQLAHLLCKRVEYVVRNVETIRKQLETERKSLNVILLAEDPNTQDEAALLLGEIIEELDESGRVVSAKVEHAGTRAADLADALEKAGVEGLKEKDGMLTTIKSTPAPQEAVSKPAKESKEDSRSSLKDRSQEVEIAPSTISSEPAPESARKPTAESTCESTIESAPGPTAEPATQPARIEDQGMDSDAWSVAHFATNAADTEEEANLRREMINYNLDTMNAIVAELDLAEDASDVSYDDDPDNPNLVPDSDFDLDLDSDLEDEDEEEESEDEKGASKHLRLSTKYQEQMEELQKKLGLSGLKNLGPDPELPDDVKREIDRLSGPRPSAAEAARNAALQRANANATTEEEKMNKVGAAVKEQRKPKNAGKRKKVAFSDVLDIADETATSRPQTQQLPSRPKASQTVVNPVKQTIMERNSVDEDSSSVALPAPPQPPSAPARSTKPKLSQFKQRKQAALQPPSTDFSPTPPTDSLVADTILERPAVPTFTPPDPYAIDDEMHRRQVALEYHKLKSRKIHQQGGYVKNHSSLPGDDDDDDDWYIKDEDTGTVRKVSRFKAARLQS